MKELGGINLVEDLVGFLPLKTEPNEQCKSFEEALFQKIAGQPEAVLAMSGMHQTYIGGLGVTNKPVGSMLLLGPTGSGKTRVVEAAAEVLFGDSNAMIKVDCAEFKHSHYTAKLTGSPPGYLGHRETVPLLTQEALAKHHTNNLKLTLLLFDEIEKASEDLWELLLGILDKARLTLGDNRVVDFSNCIIAMTSNLGAREMSRLAGNGIGFQDSARTLPTENEFTKIGVEAARKKFSPEFFNRLDTVVVCQPLTRPTMIQILDLELGRVRHRINKSDGPQFVFSVHDSAKEFLLKEGFDQRYGARPLKRAIEKLLILPVSRAISCKEITTGDLVIAYFDQNSDSIKFGKFSSAAQIDEPATPARAARGK